jgi:endonuclease YncB( thermonuclease family)
MAWVFEKYIGESSGAIQTSYYAAQTAAQQECRGLWIDPHPIEPWLYRHPAENQRDLASRSGTFNHLQNEL